MMNRAMSVLNRVSKVLFGTRAAGLYILIFAIAIGVATFIENDFGTSSAQKVVYRTGWFELLLALFAGTLVANIIRFRMIQQRKWALFLFHAAMIVILLGAGITRYFGEEGMMHIREGSVSNKILSSETFLNIQVEKKGHVYRIEEPVLFATLGDHSFHELYQIGDDLIKVRVLDFIPNPQRNLKEDEDGVPILKIVVAGMNGREEYFVSPGEMREVRGLLFDFTGRETPGAVQLKFESNELFLKYDKPLSRMVMATMEKDTFLPDGSYQPLKLRSMYSDGQHNFVFGDFVPSGKVEIESASAKVKSESLTALLLEVSLDDQTQQKYVYGQKGVEGKPVLFSFGDKKVAVSYGSRYIEMPFSIALHDFILERYPGTNSAASYASEVQLIDPRTGLKKDFRIYMNHILAHDGYRFFQSSFDRDEQGTVLSVNHDFWGTRVSYFGYFLLTLGMLMVFFSKRTRFYAVLRKLEKIRSQAAMLLFLLVSQLAFANGAPLVSDRLVIDQDHAERFSRLVVQDYKGRMKPVHTLTREVLRKVARKSSLYGLTADQLVLSMFAETEDWLDVPLIKIPEGEDMKEWLGVEGERVSYEDFFNEDGSYKLREQVRRAYEMPAADRGTREKEIMKVDERVNIVGLIFSGSLFRLVPVPQSPNRKWASAMPEHGNQEERLELADRFFSAYRRALQNALKSGDYSEANQLLQELQIYQKKEGGDLIPSSAQIKAEIFLNSLNVFSRLALFYALLGFAFLVLLFTSIFYPGFPEAKVRRILFWTTAAGFAFHTLGLALRWYVSGRAPWSNGYESMIYIGWMTALAGLIFTRRSTGGLAATMVLSGTILLVAMLSYLDPEITPLVPVLKSYWLTIHVSLIAGSYGFLMLGAIMGFMNLLLMVLLSGKNKTRIKRIVQEMTYMSELTLTVGLIMLSIGTYLGGVWANESWGRYWGWDAKETWALVTILVYAFILHMRIIPRLYSLYAYNLATLFGFASVAMTYFGVNYYLSGLHSYAAGDPVPVPGWVYVAVTVVFITALLAYWRKKKFAL